MGAKGKFQKWLEEENLALIEGWSKAGLSQEQIAHNMGIGLTTLKKWKDKYEAIGTALKNGREVADFYVENAMYKSACGYYVTEMEQKLDMQGNVKDTYKKKWIPPNTTAQIFWLKNRKPEEWRDRPAEVVAADHSGRQQFIEAVNKDVDREDIAKLYEEDDV